MSMKEVHDIIMKVRATKGSNAKRDILLANQDNLELRDFLFHVYEPTLSYYQSKIKPFNNAFSQFNEQAAKPTFDRSFLDQIKRNLAYRNITGNAAANWLATVYSDFEHEWEKELLFILINRDIKAGVGIGTINKVWPKLITDPPYMRCSLPKEAKVKEFPWERGCFSEVKYDGMFSFTKVWPDSSYEVSSRNGSLFPPDPFLPAVTELLPIVNAIAEQFPEEEYWRIEGEMLAYLNGEVLPREKGNGVFNSILQSGEVPEGLVPFIVIWDFLPASQDHSKGRFDVPREKRVALLVDAFTEHGAKQHTDHMEFKVVHSFDEAKAHYKAMRLRGEEGTVIKHPDAIWMDGDSKQQVKMKATVAVELEIIGFNPADPTSKNAELFGSLQCRSSDDLLETGVGVGFSDGVRKDLWERRQFVKGGIITVVANGIMTPSDPNNPTGKYSLFLPRYIEERKDKSVADSLARIQQQFDEALDKL